ncbi:radical SAM protein [Desulfosporosinus sp.]|uniref:B12-binding domain-containing radical SAM protein n=1 Tax=Desulfosporosinus sp. TaxID=157907 RepID=UPI0025C6C73E|nr:radical SAM protein [Desulfosporosinus sp.]MBC2721338.1 B12-binding domain-containing radical SAM protein [Desulfosporosinus sp.]MBC2728808.1 B12-binding domain-containing radical SAM protein [Desulfosporosinus sp.]
MKTILMITPENSEINRFRAKQHNNFTQLTMPYLAGFVPEQYRIRLIDEYSERIEFERYDLVAITVNTPNAPHVYQISTRFRELGSWVVLGGPHVTLNPEEAATYSDTVFVGESEETWPQFLTDFLVGKQQKVYKCESTPSLEGLPVARRDLISGHRFTSGAIFATRGCPHNCSYCCLKKIYNKEFRTRPIHEVVNEIRIMRNRYFVFWDDNFFANPDYTKSLLKEITPLKKRWAAQVTAQSCHDEELLSLAKKAGCVYLFLGLESFSEQGLVDANKSFNHIDQYKIIVDKLHQHGISVQAGIVFGFDSDTPEIFEKTLNACETLGIDGVTPSILTPFPGTPIYDQYKRDGRLLNVDWSYYNSKTQVAFTPKNMSVEELLSGCDSFRSKFLSIKSITRRVIKSKVNLPYTLLMNWGYRRAYIGFKKARRT